MAPLANRNNNPGNLRLVGQEGATQGEGGFAAFGSPEAGMGALMNDIQHKIKTHPDWTLADFSNVWAPPSDNNDTAQYTANLANQLKVAPTTRIADLQANIGNFAEAIAANEGYQGDLPGVESLNTPTETSQTPDWLKAALGAGGAVLGGIGSLIQQNSPGIGAAIGGAVGGPKGAFIGEQMGSNLFGGNEEQPQQQGQVKQLDAASAIAQLQEQSSPNESKISDIIHQAMQGTQTNRVFSGSQSGQSAIGAMGVYGYVPDVDENGYMDFSSAKEKADQNESSAAELEMKAAGDTKVPLMTALNYAGQYLGRNRMLAPDQKKAIADYVGEYARAYGPANGSITAEDAVKARHQQYAATKGRYGELSTTQVEARKALAYGFREAALKNSANPELQEAAIGEQKKHIQAQEIMRRLNQKRAPVNQSVFKSALLKTAARYAEIYIGDKIGGPIGAVLAMVAGEHLNRVIAKKLSKTKFDTKEMRAAFDILHETKPDVYQELIKKLEENGVNFTPQNERGNTTAKEIEKDVATDFKTIKGLVKLPGTKTKPISPKGIQSRLTPKQ